MDIFPDPTDNKHTNKKARHEADGRISIPPCWRDVVEEHLHAPSAACTSNSHTDFCHDMPTQTTVQKFPALQGFGVSTSVVQVQQPLPITLSTIINYNSLIILLRW